MYTGHLSVALGAVRARRSVPLWLLMLASQLPDWVQVGFSAIGHGEDPFEAVSHSLPSSLIVALALFLIYDAYTRDWRGALLVGGVSLSHPVLDLLTAAKTFLPGVHLPRACLYDHPVRDFAVESALAVMAWLLYRGTLGARRNRPGSWAILATLIAAQGMADAAQLVRIHRWPDRASCAKTQAT